MSEESPLTNSGANPVTNDSGRGDCAVDATKERDRGLVRRLYSRSPKRWDGVTDEVKKTVFSDLEWARREARAKPESEADPLNGAKVVISVAKTIAVLEGANQADEHQADADANAKAGLVINAAALMNDRQKIDLYIAAGRPDLLPERLREVATKEGLIAGD